MKKSQSQEKENCPELPVIPNESSVNKPVVPSVYTQPTQAVNLVEARKEMEAFKQEHCWIDTKELTNDAVAIWGKLKNSPLVPFNYKVNFGEKRGTIQTASIDGLKFVLHSGFDVKVPMEIYGLLQNKINVESGVGSDLNIENQSDEVKAALTR